jgi:uncharacterized OsmC-like protein
MTSEPSFSVTVAAGSYRNHAAVTFPHRWTDQGVTVDADFTGAHLLHLAAAGCVLNDVYREARDFGVTVDGVRVHASGGFDPDTWASTGIVYTVDVDTPASAEDLARLLGVVDAVAEIPRSLRQGATVSRAV